MFRIKNKRVLEGAFTIKALDHARLRVFCIDLVNDALEAPPLKKEEVAELRDPILFYLVGEIIKLHAQNMEVPMKAKPNKLSV